MSADSDHNETRLVIREHTATFPDPLVLEAGEQVHVGRADEQWPAFLWCTTVEGKGGWVPESFLQREGDVGAALRNYDACEMTVKIGDRVCVGERAGGWVWASNAAGESGWIPEECIGEVDQSESST